MASEWKTLCVLEVWKNSTLCLHIPVLLGLGPVGPTFPFVGQTGNSLWDLPGLRWHCLAAVIKRPVSLVQGAVDGVRGAKLMGVGW